MDREDVQTVVVTDSYVRVQGFVFKKGIEIDRDEDPEKFDAATSGMGNVGEGDENLFKVIELVEKEVEEELDPEEDDSEEEESEPEPEPEVEEESDPEEDDSEEEESEPEPEEE